MSEAELQKANEIAKKIRELEIFIRQAERVWTGKIIKRTSKFIFKSSSYGALEATEYFMDTELKNKVLNVLREELADLKRQLQTI